MFALQVDLAGAERVDVEVGPGDQVLFQFLDVPFDAARGEVLVACQLHYQVYGDVGTFRVFARDGGQRREVGVFVIDHVWP